MTRHRPIPPKKSKIMKPCAVCGLEFSIDDLTIDWKNFRLVCKKCKLLAVQDEEG